MRLPALAAGTPAMYALIALAVIGFVGQQATGGALTRSFLLYGPAVASGEWWRLATSGFLHGDLLHIGLNGFMLYALGGPLERGIGTPRFLMVAAGSLLGGALAVLAFDYAQPTLGASGIVMGVAAAFAVSIAAQGGDVRRHPTFGLVIMNLAIPLFFPGISFWGHLGGAVGGAIVAWFVVWLPLRSRRP